MTLIDRKNLTVFGTYAMEGINEIYPSPSASAIRDIVQPSSEQSQAVYRLDGRKVNGEPLSPGFYIRQGKKFVKM